MEDSPYHYERLSAVDALLLDLEDRCNLMHVGAVLLLDGEGLRGAEGALDVEQVVCHVEARLADLPRYRQRLRRVPFLQHPVWVDADFDVRAHVRPVSLPRPGGEAALKALVGQIMGEPLDRRLPLWELYVVDGVGDGRFAVVAKVHHCIVDGVLGMAVLASLLSTEPVGGDELRVPYTPRPAPPAAQLFHWELRHRGTRTAGLLHQGRQLLARPSEGRERLKALVRGLLSYARALLPVSVTPLNGAWVGTTRRFDWAWVDLQRVKALKRRTNATVNDVVLAVIAGAVQRYLRECGVDPSDVVFRAMVPVSQHGQTMNLSEGNRVSIMVTPLPVDEPDPGRRLERTAANMREIKSVGQASSLSMMEGLADLTTSQMLAEAAHRIMRLRPFSMIVTNMPGPRMPLYLLGARLVEAYPLVPLFVSTGVGVAVLSYAGRLGFGINMDGRTVPRPEAFVRAIGEALDELEGAGALKGTAPAEDDAPSSAPPHPRSG